MGFVKVIAGVTDKRNMCVPTGSPSVGTNCGQREFATCFKEWEVGNKSLSKKGVEVKFVWSFSEVK